VAYDLYDVSGSGTTYAAGTRIASNTNVTATGGNNILGDNANDRAFVANGGGNGQAAGSYAYLGLALYNGTVVGFFGEIPGSNQVVLFVIKGTYIPAGATLTEIKDNTQQNYTQWNLSTGHQNCFTAGTMILTPTGEIAAESLAAGDLVVAADGRTVPVRWAGRQTVSRVFADPLRALPIRISAGALGENMPIRDLSVSPEHALLIDGVLIQAAALVNGTSIVRDQSVPQVFAYYHIELATHELLVADGAPAESFIDNVDRMGFDNWAERGDVAEDAIEEMAYPRAKSARQVPMSIRQRIALRATQLAGTTAAAA
jgi:hypothetical protein